MAGQFIKRLHPRYKRSDCVYYLSIPQSCLCGDHCWIDSYKYALATDCGTDSTLNCCVIRNENAYQLSSNCPAMGTYQNIACARTGNVCIDGLTAYQCTCSNGYLVPTTAASSKCDSTCMIGLGTALPLVLVCIAVLISALRLRAYRRKKAAELDGKIQSGIIPIKCNVMILVDDLDEFKDYTTRLTVALEDRYPKIVCERLSTYNAINENYEIKCDNLLVFIRKIKSDTLNSLTKKIRFRKYRKISIFALCKDTKQPEKTMSKKEMVKDICLVSCMRHFEGWLPAVIKSLFDNTTRFSCNDTHNRTYFISTDLSSKNNELRGAVQTVLAVFGATQTEYENTAVCKLAFLGSKNDTFLTNKQTMLKGYFIFVTSSASLDGYVKGTDVSVYGRKDVILGVLRLLFQLKSVSCKKMPNIQGIRYNPVKKEFKSYP